MPTLAELASQQQTLPKLPAVKAKAGENVWVIPCALAASGCASVSSDMQSIMKDHLNWKVTVFDGQANPTTQIAGINQAIVAHANAIVLIGIDCTSVKSALLKARSAGIPVISHAGVDCTGSDKNLMVSGDIGGSGPAQFDAQGAGVADYVAAQTHGHAKVIVATETDAGVVVGEYNTFKARLEKVCPQCVITAEAPMTLADLSNNTAAQKLSSVLLQNPTANIVAVMQDFQLGYVTDAMRTSSNKLPVVSEGGTAADVQLIKNGEIQGLSAIDFPLSAWVTTDAVVRSLAKTKVILPSPSVLTLVDKNHNLPSSGGFISKVNYEQAYDKSWGVR